MQHNLCHSLVQQPNLGKSAHWCLAVNIDSYVSSETSRVPGDTV